MRLASAVNQRDFQLDSWLTSTLLQKHHNTIPFAMSQQLITISNLKFIKPADLANSLSQPQALSKVAVIDVRDNDHLGGHVKNSQWVPINQLDARMPELLRVNREKERVVFHCMLSQQRGPKAALAYARARAYEVSKREKERRENDGEDEEKEGAKEDGKIGGQEVCVLEGGFGNWQSFYGDDERLTEGYVKDLWD